MTKKLYRPFTARFLRVDDSKVEEMLASGKWSTERNAPPTPPTPKKIEKPVEPKPKKEPKPQTPYMSVQRCARLYHHAEFRGGLTSEQVKAIMREKFGIESAKELTFDMYHAMIEYINATKFPESGPIPRVAGLWILKAGEKQGMTREQIDEIVERVRGTRLMKGMTLNDFLAIREIVGPKVEEGVTA